MKNNALLLLEDGTLFIGLGVGYKGISSGEICFNTGMTGYQEIFSDPSYTGQIMTLTNVHVGNYGIMNNESESNKATISGLVCKSFSHGFSRPAAHTSLNQYLIANNVVGITNVDTRFLVAHIREKGAMNAVLSNDGKTIEELQEILKATPSMHGLELASKVSTKESITYPAENEKFHVALIDFGVKQNIIRHLQARGCKVTCYPHDVSFDIIKEANHSGIMLSNGPGDPSSMKVQIELINRLKTLSIPIYGICLGHQLLALSYGINTYKMKNGHRGINHPVKNLLTGKSEITSQNHGFSVVYNDVVSNKEIEITHLNLNDKTIEGIRDKKRPFFSVQHHPEAAPGPLDSNYFFDDFVAAM